LPRPCCRITARAEKLLAPPFIERVTGVLADVKLIEDDFGPRQQLGHHVSIRPMHIATDGLDGGALPGVDPLREQHA
jgi:hypothetical protein